MTAERRVNDSRHYKRELEKENGKANKIACAEAEFLRLHGLS